MMPSHKLISRREILKKYFSAVTGAGLWTASRDVSCIEDTCDLCHSPELPREAYQLTEKAISIDLNKAPQLVKVGGSAQIIDDLIPGPLLIVRLEEERFIVLSNKCTHGGAEVTYNPRKHLFVCTSFSRSTFDVEGDVIKGPARGPLPAYEAHLHQGKLEVVLP